MMRTALSFNEAAYIVGTGLSLSLFQKEDVTAWADRHIAEMDHPPAWLLELSTMRTTDPYHAGQIVLPYVPRGEPTTTCGVLLALFPPLADFADEQLRPLNSLIFNIARTASNGEWNNPILREADWIDESFTLLDEKYYKPPGLTMESIRTDIEDLFREFSLPEPAAALSPIRCRVEL